MSAVWAENGSGNHIGFQHPVNLLQFLMWETLRASFGNHPKLRRVDLGQAVDLTDRKLCFDGLHLTTAGNRIIAENLLASVTETLERNASPRAILKNLEN